MSNTEMIERLCEICEKQNEIIREQTAALEQMGAVVDEEKREEARLLYDKLLGDGELPDW